MPDCKEAKKSKNRLCHPEQDGRKGVAVKDLLKQVYDYNTIIPWQANEQRVTGVDGYSRVPPLVSITVSVMLFEQRL